MIKEAAVAEPSIWRAPLAIFNGASMAQNRSAPLKKAPSYGIGANAAPNAQAAMAHQWRNDARVGGWITLALGLVLYLERKIGHPSSKKSAAASDPQQDRIPAAKAASAPPKILNHSNACGHSKRIETD